MMTELKGRILVYSVIGCPHCIAVKDTLQALRLPYCDVSLDVFPSERELLRKRTQGRNTVPQVFFNNIYLGGSSQFHALVDDREEFEKVLDEVKHNVAPLDAPVPPDSSQAVMANSVTELVCEPDEYHVLVEQMRETGLIRDHKDGLFRVHHKSFSGKAFVQWVMHTKRLDEAAAMNMGQQMIDRCTSLSLCPTNVFSTADDAFYRLVEDDDSTALNIGDFVVCGDIKQVGEFAEDMRRLLLNIYSTYVSYDRKRIDYSGIGKCREFETYMRMSKQLMSIMIHKANRDEKLAFFINIYNTLMIHGSVAYGMPRTIWQRWKFFNTVAYIIGGRRYSLQDIENGVLRANRKGRGMLRRPFRKGDPRLEIALEDPEPLVHFALVCGATSCPPIRTYSTIGIDAQLKLSAASFLGSEDGCRVNRIQKHIELSSIFKWYKEDFGNTNKELVMFVYNHMDDGEKRSQLDELIQGGKFKVSFLSYNWEPNMKHSHKKL